MPGPEGSPMWRHDQIPSLRRNYDPGDLGSDFRYRVEKLPEILAEAAFRAIDDQEHLAEPADEYSYHGAIPETPSNDPAVFTPEEIEWGIPNAAHQSGVI